jgi:hypothetical protein
VDPLCPATRWRKSSRQPRTPGTGDRACLSPNPGTDTTDHYVCLTEGFGCNAATYMKQYRGAYCPACPIIPGQANGFQCKAIPFTGGFIGCGIAADIGKASNIYISSYQYLGSCNPIGTTGSTPQGMDDNNQTTYTSFPSSGTYQPCGTTCPRGVPNNGSKPWHRNNCRVNPADSTACDANGVGAGCNTITCRI